MEQVIATVDISNVDTTKLTNADVDLSKYGSAVSSTDIIKRELVSYFLNVGYSYVQNNHTYEETFNALVEALVNNAVLAQYSTVAILQDKCENGNDPAILQKFTSQEDEVKKYELLLDKDELNLATYKFYSSINSAIDNYEKNVIDEEDSYTGTATRTTPINLNTEQDDYYPKKMENGELVLDDNGDPILDYSIYTGYGDNTLQNSGAYKDDALEGTTRSTRVKAYNSFLNNLRRNNLVNDDEKAQNLTKIEELEYIKTEKVSQLKSQLINKYYDLYEAKQEEKLISNDYEYINNVYKDVFTEQKENFDKSTSTFDSAMSNMSSSSFILYSPDTSDSDWYEENANLAKYGFIYNILLPFNARQSVELSKLQSIRSDDGDDEHYFAERNKLLMDIKTVDQRSAWFNGTTDYSFEPDASFGDYFGKTAGRKYLFFEDSLTNSGKDGRYKALQAYDGRYAYNGQVVKNEDGSYTLIPKKLTIDGMLEEFKAYVEYVLGTDRVSYDITPDYGKTGFMDEEDEIDYSKFIYAEGTVSFDKDPSNLMYSESDQYKAMSAVNELQFAYTTDTSVLSNYVGYSLSAYDTNYIKEFEYAAKKAVGNGVGSFAVCAGDYGWHLIYVTYVFDFGEDGTVYTNLNWKDNIKVEGTFENLFFEWVKGNDLTDISTTRRTRILNDFNKDTTVTKYQKRYQDLLDIDKK